MAVTQVVFETHSTTEDNEQGLATGWLPGKLSVLGREQARAMGDRRRADRIAAVFTSDLDRAVETVAIAFADSTVPVLHDSTPGRPNWAALLGTIAPTVKRGEPVTPPTSPLAGGGGRTGARAAGRR